MKCYRLTPAARADLDGTWRYSVRVWGNVQARLYVEEIRATLDGLAANQRRSQSAEHVRPGYRRISVGRHVLFFTEGSETIDVVRILHQQMDMPRQLDDDL